MSWHVMGRLFQCCKKAWQNINRLINRLAEKVLFKWGDRLERQGRKSWNLSFPWDKPEEEDGVAEDDAEPV